jgi:hypothetical protein
MFRLTAEPVRRTEADVIKESTKILRRRGYWVQRIPVGKFRTMGGDVVEFGPVGVPDFIAVHRTFPAFYAEFKRPGKLLRETQRTKFSDIQIFYGLHAVMVDSVDEMLAFLVGHEKRSTNGNAPDPPEALVQQKTISPHSKGRDDDNLVSP